MIPQATYQLPLGSGLHVPGGPQWVQEQVDQVAVPRGVLTQRFAPAPVNTDRYQINYGSGLTPQVATSALQLANYGQLYLLADILDECRETDAHLQAVLQKREAAIASADWSIQPEDSSDLEQKQIAKWVEAELRSVHLDDVLPRMMAALYYGRYVFEQVWVEVDGQLRLIDIQWLHPRRFGYGHYDWRLHLWDQTGNERTPDLAAYPGIALDAFPAGKFLVHEPNVRSGYPQREGLGRTTLWYSMFKRWGIRDLLSFLEWAGRGIRVGTYKTGTDEKSPTARATQDQVDILEQALMNMSSSLQVLIPDTTSLDIKELHNVDHPAHLKFADWCDAQNSKVVLGGTLTTDPGTKGARGLGDTQKEEQEMLARSDMRACANTLHRDTIVPMIRHRHGLGATTRVKFVAHIERKLDPIVASTWILNLVKAGAEIPQSFVQKTFDYPAPADGEAVLLPKKLVASEGDEIAHTGDGTVSPERGGSRSTDSNTEGTSIQP